MSTLLIVEFRDAEGNLVFGEKERAARKAHPYLFSKPEGFTVDELCYWMSFAEGRNKARGPMYLGDFLRSFGFSYRMKTW
jgi:hypothetical protein